MVQEYLETVRPIGPATTYTVMALNSFRLARRSFAKRATLRANCLSVDVSVFR